jgi:ATP-binding cassette subfamily C protein/ATP-binding cassette subfamily C protein EexD
MYRVGAFTAKMSAFSKFVRFSAQIAVLGLGAYLATLGEITAGAMIAASIIMGRALAPADQAMGAWRGFIAARNAQRRIRDVFLSVPVESEKLLQPSARGHVTFEGVALMLPGMEKPLLRSIDLDVPPSRIVAIVGASGSGKSTFCRMLIGAVNPNAGSVRLDGVTIANWNREQFSRSVGYLAQSVQLLDGTVSENIARMGQPDSATVVEAAHLAGCHDLINRLPQGYDTVIGSSGVMLSGGQAQRIGLARALYGKPRLLVLDEPNANLDSEGDAALQNAIVKMREAGSAVFIVSHRPTALSQVDLIVTIDNGTIAKTQTRE